MALLPRRVHILLALILIAAASVAAAGEYPYRSPEYLPADWFAFVAGETGYTPHVANALYATPRVIIYRDGRIVWRQAERDRIGACTDPERWREARLDRRQLEELARFAREKGFLDLRPELPQYYRANLDDASRTRVGLALPGGRKRVVDVYGLESACAEPTADALTRSTAEVANAILRLRSKQSHRMVPTAIRMALCGPCKVPGYGTPVRWPLVELPEKPSQCVRYYEGAEALVLTSGFVGTDLTRIGARDYFVGWAPAITIPEATVDAGPISGYREQPEPEPLPAAPLRPLPPPACVLTGHRDYVSSLAWSPDSRRLATASDIRDTPRLWEARSGRLIQSLPEGHTKRLAWMPNGSRLVVARVGGLLLWRDNAGSKTLFDRFPVWNTALALSPDGSKVAFGSRLQVAQLDIRKTVWELPEHYEPGHDIAWSPDGQMIATSDRWGALELFDVRTGRLIRSVGRPLGPDDPGYYARGMYPALKNGRYRFPPRQWEPEDRYRQRRPIAWEPGGKLVAVPDERASVIRIWDSETGKAQRPLPYHGPMLNALSWSTDRRYLAATGGTTLHIYDLRTGRHRSFGGNTNLYAGAWSPDNRRFAAGTSERSVMIWDATALRREGTDVSLSERQR